MDLKDMQYFCTIVEEGQISKAAKKLNISQPPLSLRLKEMEKELGVSLILRTSGQWKVTAEGQVLYHNCQQILSHANGLAETIRDVNSRCRGQVRIGIGSHCISFFQKIIPALMENYPDISCRTVVADSPTIERHLQERVIELAVLRLNLSVTVPHSICRSSGLWLFIPTSLNRRLKATASALRSWYNILCSFHAAGPIPTAFVPSWPHSSPNA